MYHRTNEINNAFSTTWSHLRRRLAKKWLSLTSIRGTALNVLLQTMLMRITKSGSLRSNVDALLRGSDRRFRSRQSFRKLSNLPSLKWKLSRSILSCPLCHRVQSSNNVVSEWTCSRHRSKVGKLRRQELILWRKNRLLSHLQPLL
jgi:hypothetical protein